MPNTKAVSVTFTLNSTTPTTPPYNITGCGGTVTYDDDTTSTIDGFNAEDIGTPDSSGASFTLNVTDSGYNSTSNATSIGNWALTCIPRSPTTVSSPFAANQNTITGSGATNNNGTFTLSFDNPQPKIKNAGNFDWSLMVQVIIPVPKSRQPPTTVTHCFGSDPEMDVT